MLDVKFIRENLELVRENIRNRGVGNADPDQVVALNTQRVELIQQTEAIRKERNENAQKMKGQMPPEERSELIERGKELKEQLASYEEKLGQAEEELNHALKNIPNMTHPDVPIGGEDARMQRRTVLIWCCCAGPVRECPNRPDLVPHRHRTGRQRRICPLQVTGTSMAIRGLAHIEFPMCISMFGRPFDDVAKEKPNEKVRESFRLAARSSASLVSRRRLRQQDSESPVYT